MNMDLLPSNLVNAVMMYLSIMWWILIRDIKAIGDGSPGITMCVGEQSEEAYRRMREAGR